MDFDHFLFYFFASVSIWFDITEVSNHEPDSNSEKPLEGTDVPSLRLAMLVFQVLSLSSALNQQRFDVVFLLLFQVQCVCVWGGGAFHVSRLSYP